MLCVVFVCVWIVLYMCWLVVVVLVFCVMLVVMCVCWLLFGMWLFLGIDGVLVFDVDMGFDKFVW